MKYKTKLFSFLLALLVCTATAFAAAPSFTDVPANYWASGYIEQAAENGWVNGVGNGKYAPEDKVTGAEFVTMVSRVFYQHTMQDPKAGEPWYQCYVDAAKAAGGLPARLENSSVLNSSLSRYDMATVMAGLVDSHELIEGDFDTSKIGDWAQIPSQYKDAVKTAYAMNWLNGVNDAGDFGGSSSMTRAQAAVVLVRMNIRVNDPSAEEPSIPGSTTPKKPTTEPEEPTTEPETLSANYGPVGTMSDTPVTLSYETHKPVTDYWSSAPADIRAITDQEAYNCAVQTLKDQDMIRDPSVLKDGINPYYNYPVFKFDGTQDEINVTSSMSRMGGYVGFGSVSIKKDLDGTSYRVMTATKRVNSEDYDAVIDPILAKLNDGMSDKQKAEILVQAIDNRYDYEVGQSFRWNDPAGSTGDCESYMIAVNDIFNAAGLHVLSATGSNHGWNYAYLDGTWYVVDATVADVGSNLSLDTISNLGFFTNVANYESGLSDLSKVAMALIESAFA